MINIQKYILIVIIFLAAIGIPYFAKAENNEDLIEILESLKYQLQVQQEQINKLQAKVDYYDNLFKKNSKNDEETSTKIAKNEEKIAATEKKINFIDKKITSEVERKEQEVKIKLSPAPIIETANGSHSFKLDGRVALDTGFSHHDKADIANATNIRYLWLGTKGVIDYDWHYRLLVGLEEDNTNVNDAYISYEGFDNISIKAGNFKEFNGIENMSSNIHNTFIERSIASTTFHELRNLGLSTSIYGKNWTWQIGIFGDDPGNTATDDEGHSITTRLFYTPILNKDEDKLLHIGGSIRHRTPDASLDSVRFRSRGESNVIDTYLIDTATISNVDNWVTYAGEVRYTNGAFSAMSEYHRSEIKRNLSENLTFSGGYVGLSYFLTGEQRSYDQKQGTYGRVKPNKPMHKDGIDTGAWELATRYSYVDLNDNNITGGELESYSLGLNWYPNSNTKFMLNYVINDTDANAAIANDKPHYIMLRAQVDF